MIREKSFSPGNGMIAPVEKIELENIFCFLPLKVENLYNCLTEKFGPYEDQLCYILDNKSFVIPVKRLVRNKIINSNIKCYVENFRNSLCKESNRILFSFSSDENLQHRRYKISYYHGDISLETLEVRLELTDSEIYSST